MEVRSRRGASLGGGASLVYWCYQNSGLPLLQIVQDDEAITDRCLKMSKEVGICR